MTPLAGILLAATGFWISTYFTGVYYRWFPADVRWIPRVCRLDERSCLQVLQTPRAKIFGVPNSAFGMALYGYVALDLFLFPAWPGLLLVTAALLRSIYLAYSLVFITKIPCPLCFASHAINLFLFVGYASGLLG